MATKDISDLQVCRAVQYEATNRMELGSIEALMGETSLSYKECYRAMERAERRGLIESGVVTTRAWLTSAGISLLKGR